MSQSATNSNLDAATAHARRREIVAQQPYARMQYFAALLGWRGLSLFSHRIPDEVIGPDVNIPDGIVIYYCTSDQKFFLQINTDSNDQTRFHRATVRAERYGIINIGWHPFELFDEDERLIAEAKRLMPMLGRQWYKDRKWRRELALQHPEFHVQFSRRSQWPGRLAEARKIALKDS